MTEAIYLSDAYLKSSRAKITEIGKTADGQSFLILDQTIFYPLGGGQPSDKGVIISPTGSLTVKELQYNGGGIKHLGVLKGEFKVGQSVELSLDWPEREKHMQWHTAGHIIDLVVRQVYPKLVPVRGMHGIGKKLFVEYDGSHKLDVEKLNAKLGKVIAEKPAIETRFVTLEELKKIANWLPEKLPSSKKLRILSIGESYHIPDGGTQLKSVTELWPIQITKAETTDVATLVHYTLTLPSTVKQFNGSNHETMSASNIGESISKIKSAFESELSSVDSNESLEALRIKYLGKGRGLTTKLLEELPKLAQEEKRQYGPALNKLKREQEAAIAEALSSLSESQESRDLTIPGRVKASGRLHPTTTVIREMNSFFRYHGFSIQEGPEIETAEYNFRRLNLPEGHPATDLQDTLFLKEPDILLRTHTSSVETRVLSAYHNRLPLRVVVPGKCYRNETGNSTNTSFFYQYQGFVVDKGVNIQNLKDTLTKFHQFLFGQDVVLRFRYKYYPEVTPGMGVDMRCRFCEGVGCQVCKYRGWIEVLGSGMIHSNTLKACGIDSEVYSGFAFGMGLDRLVMSKYGITDIRKLYGGELVYV